MLKFFARFRKDESGATAIEYGLIAALISVALIAGASTLGDALNNTFDALGNKMEACVDGAGAGCTTPAGGGAGG